MVALVVGVIFYGQELTQDGVMNINGAIFLFLTNMTFQNVFSVANVGLFSNYANFRNFNIFLIEKNLTQFTQVFCAELPVFLREHRSRLYRTDAYFLGKSLAEFPLFMLVPLLFTAITYPMVGLRPTAENFGIALGVIVLVANVSTSFGKTLLFQIDGRYFIIAQDISSKSPNNKKSTLFLCFFRLFDIMCKLIDFNGIINWTTANHSILAIRWILLEQWICSSLFPMAIVFVLVPLWQ